MTRKASDEFPKHVKLAAWQRANGHCECCGTKFTGADRVEYDHIVEAALGGKTTLENCRVMRKRCHDEKTATRRPELDKTRRGFEKRIGARKKSRPMPFGRGSKYKKKITGEIVER
jgi:5-methylcytosine-specific restriction endonuclease McrA